MRTDEWLLACLPAALRRPARQPPPRPVVPFRPSRIDKGSARLSPARLACAMPHPASSIRPPHPALNERLGGLLPLRPHGLSVSFASRSTFRSELPRCPAWLGPVKSSSARFVPAQPGPVARTASRSALLVCLARRRRRSTASASPVRERTPSRYGRLSISFSRNKYKTATPRDKDF